MRALHNDYPAAPPASLNRRQRQGWYWSLESRKSADEKLIEHIPESMRAGMRLAFPLKKP